MSSRDWYLSESLPEYETVAQSYPDWRVLENDLGELATIHLMLVAPHTDVENRDYAAAKRDMHEIDRVWTTEGGAVIARQLTGRYIVCIDRYNKVITEFLAQSQQNG